VCSSDLVEQRRVEIRRWLDDMTAAYQRRDLSALQHGLSEGIVLRLAGNSQFSGTYRGAGQVMGLVARTADWARVASVDVAAIPDEGVRLSVDVEGEPPMGAARFRVEEMLRFDELGRVSEADVWSDEQQVLDDFLDRVAARSGA